MKRVSETRHRPLLNIGKVRIGLSLLCVLVLSLLMLAGCTETDVEENVIPPHALKDVEADFNLNVLASQPPVTRSMRFTSSGTIDTDTLTATVNDTVRTRAASPLGDESKIVSLWIGQYDAATGNKLFSKYVSVMTGNKVNVKLKQTGAQSHVWFVANAGDLGDVATEKALKERVLPFASTTAGLPDNSLCMMTGTWKGTVSVGGIKNITVQLTRLLARISLTYSVGPDFAFTPTSVVLKDAPTVSQLEASTAQLTAGIGYKNYTEAPGDIASNTFCWYLPENMAGTVSGADAVDAEKKKIGTGVSRATCIELTGDAEQGGVEYTGVTFRFYPGSSYNNYDIVRNSHYKMDVTLIGIDLSDERITVGEIPPIVVDPTEMPAKRGGEKEIQVTARPGEEWVFDLPDWMSALLDDVIEVDTGATLTHQGPAKVVLKIEKSNPRADARSATFDINLNGTVQQIEVTQTGSTLTKGSDISLKPEADSEGSSSFTATEGLPWSATLIDDWLDWSATNPGTSGSATPADAQTIQVKSTTVNPSDKPRQGKITVRAGESAGDTSYDGLKKDITVTQTGSEVSSSISPVTLAATPDAEGTYTLKGTAGLPYIFTSGFPSWLTVTDGTASIDGGTTTGSDQELTYKTASVNPNSTERTTTVTVQAGDISKNVVVKQAGSSFVTSASEIELPKTASTGSITVTGTAGLPWMVSPTVQSNGITPGITSATADDTPQTVLFTSTANSGLAREQTFTIAVSGGNHSLNVKVKQKEGCSAIRINQKALTSYNIANRNDGAFPPFDEEGATNYHGCIVNATRTTMEGSYIIAVEPTQSNKVKANYTTLKGHCKKLVTKDISGWRLPTSLEMHAMHEGLNPIEGLPLVEEIDKSITNYCTQTHLNGVPTFNTIINPDSKKLGGDDAWRKIFYESKTNGDSRVRCVRDL